MDVHGFEPKKPSWEHLERMFDDFIEGKPVTDTADLDNEQGSGSGPFAEKTGTDNNR
ncbi:MAG TPA: hypothetical protein VKA31_07850 [Mariprofundaceae bacterium]|jgi:hypothetical protein|nr:hypothetical protein [Mariprofundaceae bacterium]